MELSCWLAVSLVCLSTGSLCRAESMGSGLMECEGMVSVSVEEPIRNQNMCLTATGPLLPDTVNISVRVGGHRELSSFVYNVGEKKCVSLSLSMDQTVVDLEFVITAFEDGMYCMHTVSGVRAVPPPVATEFIIAISTICGLILVLILFICCLSCILCSLLRRDKGSKPKKQVVRWADTEQGNVELLAMKTLSETMLENESSDTVTVEEGKKESVDGREKEELGALTANTFGFQGEVVKNEEKPTTFDVTVTTEAKSTASTEQSVPVDSTPPTSAPSSEATPTTLVTSNKPSSSTDTSPAADSHVSTDEPASDTGKPKVTFSNDIEKILGGDLKQETHGTAL